MALIHDKVFQMRATAEFYERIDEWRRQQQGIPSRAEAIRRLLEIGLEHGRATKAAPAKRAPARKRPARLAMARGELVMAGDA